MIPERYMEWPAQSTAEDPSEAAVQARLAASLVSQTINTSFVERHNLTCRQCNGRLSRKVLSFSKDLTW